MKALGVLVVALLVTVTACGIKGPPRAPLKAMEVDSPTRTSCDAGCPEAK